jgi:hypothetical protein
MMQKRSLYSLLLTSFMLVFAFTLSQAQTVTFESKTVLRCQDNTINVTVNNPTDISAFEIVFAVSGDGSFSSVTWKSTLSVLTNRYIDLSNPGVVRIAGMMIDPGDGCLAAGPTVVAQVNLQTADVCTGAAVVDGTSLTIDKCGTCSINATTQFVDCASGELVAAAVTAGTVTIHNANPTIAAIDDISVHFIDYIVPITTVADDGDLHSVPGGCEALSYSINAPTTAGAGPSISAAGLITWHPTGADIGVHDITVTVNDGCGGSASTMFSACVWNIPPTLVCGDDIFTGWGDLIEGTVTGEDLDGGPSPLLYTVNSFTGPGMVNINPANGDWSWQTEFEAVYTGTFTLCIGVTDGANIVPGCSPNNSAECCLEITVVPYLITIEKTHNTIQGQEETVDIFMLDDGYKNYPMGGFDFLIKYDASALILNTVDPGAFILDAGWEYFTYRYGESGNCGSNACPSGIVRIVSIADMNNGANHPDYYTNDPAFDISNQLAVMRFLVTDDRTLECQYVPIRWIWYDCGDNAISSVTGDSLFISRYIWEFEGDFGDPTSSIHNPAYAFPSLFGANSSCDVSGGVDKPEPLRFVDFINGGIDIVCADSIDARGDINLNGIDNEIADAVLFSNYFVHGLSVFDTNVDGQIAASDVNADGIVLSVADLVYLIRIIVGDALPYYKPGTQVKVNYIHADNGLMTVDGAKIGAAFVVAEGEVTPELRADGMEMRYAFDGTNTRILVYSMEANSFTGEFLNVNGNVLSIEMATAEGNQVNAKLIPTNFSLAQNYPNPFNPTTSIAFSLPMASDYTLTIFNVSGQTITTFEGANEAGNVVLDWDANDLASGIYFYRLDAGSFSETKKMVLLK